MNFSIVCKNTSKCRLLTMFFIILVIMIQNWFTLIIHERNNNMMANKLLVFYGYYVLAEKQFQAAACNVEQYLKNAQNVEPARQSKYPT